MARRAVYDPPLDLVVLPNIGRFLKFKQDSIPLNEISIKKKSQIRNIGGGRDGVKPRTYAVVFIFPVTLKNKKDVCEYWYLNMVVHEMQNKSLLAITITNMDENSFEV